MPKLFDVINEALNDLHYILMDGYDDEDALEKLPEGTESKCVEDKGGEGQGDEYYAVWKFSLNGEVCFIRFDGYYLSFGVSEYESCWEVKPETTPRTEYVRIKE